MDDATRCSSARLEGMTRERESEGRIIFYDSLLSNPSSLTVVYTLAERPIRYVETPSNPLSRGSSNAKSFPPLLRRGGGGKTAARGGWVGEGDAIALHWVRVITPSKASR